VPGVTIPHLVDLGTEQALVGRRLHGVDGWEALRTQSAGAYSVPPDRLAWQAAADARPELAARMQAVAALLEDLAATSAVSYGAGSALAERWLLRASPQLRLTVTDVGDGTVRALRGLLGEAAQVRRHDLLADAPLPADAHLFNRLDTEFSGRAWRGILRRFERETVVLVATDVLTLPRLVEQLRAMPSRRAWTRAGWERTRGAFESLWRATHDAEPFLAGDLDAWLLRPRS
jgi:hypothetical protein